MKFEDPNHLLGNPNRDLKVGIPFHTSDNEADDVSIKWNEQFIAVDFTNQPNGIIAWPHGLPADKVSRLASFLRIVFREDRKYLKRIVK